MYNANLAEQEILKFWEDNQIFEKSISQRPENKPYVFYDGPPFATGLPHYGHILSSVIKDVVPRYWTMKGYRVRRRWGWDCHGLPIENLVEKELKISGRKQIEETIGVEKFNDTCRSKVLLYTKEWKKMVSRIGRWVEFDNAYKTMDSTYMESVWWALKTIWEKGLIYEGRKVLMYCPRCETPVSKAEIAMDNSYKDITEETATVKFKIINPQKHNLPENTYILAWTTTPWTLPGNVALAVGESIKYVLVQIIVAEGAKKVKNGVFESTEWYQESYLVAKDRLEKVMINDNYKVIKELDGRDLVGIEYEPLFEIKAVKDSGKKAWYVSDADFVTTEEGTGIVHTAVIYGEDDYNLGVKKDLPMVPLLDEKGIFNNDAPEFIRGQYFKKAEKLIKQDLESRKLLFAKQNHTHSYPHCWRCDTPLFYNAISAWFIDIQKIKERLIKLNEKINWFPDHLKNGRFLNILETAPDWNISRNRYWATPLPFWKCKCGHKMCIGSVKELRQKANNFNEVYQTDKVEEMDLHKDKMDRVNLKCDKCGEIVNRIPEVIDCWVESGSMPFAEFHYPFENEEVFKARFPGQYIAEYIAQTRAWFYYMHVMAVLLFDDISFENVVCTGTILNDKGEKLSKSKMNYTDPWQIIDTYGVDALRYYLMSGVVMQAENLFFNEREVRDIYNKLNNTLMNVVEFYGMYSEKGEGRKEKGKKSRNVLDRWILAKLQVLIKDVTVGMEQYNMTAASRPIVEFIAELSQWYVRRSRDRFKGDDEDDKVAAVGTLREVLLTLSKIMAPFTPFMAETIYQTIEGKGESGKGKGVLSSVHLEEWPKVDESLVDEEVIADMIQVRKIVEMGLSLRAEAGIKVKQVLGKSKVKSLKSKVSDEFLKIIAEELNVKVVEMTDDEKMDLNWITKEEGEITVSLNIEITEELKKAGLVREVVRAINQKRKEMKLTISDQIKVMYSTEDPFLLEIFKDKAEEIKKNVLASELELSVLDTEEIQIDERSIRINIEKCS